MRPLPAKVLAPESDPHEGISTAQIGRCGELLVQYRLLLRGIESAALTTDSGIDLVAYGARSRSPFTIQVKSNLAPKRGGGKGKLSLDWWIPESSPAQFHALVDLSTERVWILTHQELLASAQQRSSSGRLHIFMYVDETVRPRRTDLRMLASEFKPFLLENRIKDLP